MYLLSPRKAGVETSLKLEEVKRFHSHPSLQDGEYQTFEESSPSRRLPNKSRSQGCLFNRTYDQYWKFLHFIWKVTIFKFDTLPFGLATAPIKFTELLQLVAASLHSQGIWLLIYLDDMLLAAQTSATATHQITIVTNLLESLGFTLNQKSAFYLLHKT